MSRKLRSQKQQVQTLEQKDMNTTSWGEGGNGDQSTYVICLYFFISFISFFNPSCGVSTVTSPLLLVAVVDIWELRIIELVLALLSSVCGS